jgi:hypothetical protein
VGIDDTELPVVPALVCLGQAPHHLVGGMSGLEQLEPVRAVRHVGERLRGHGADLRLRPRDDRADGEKLRLHGDSPFPPLEVAGDD